MIRRSWPIHFGTSVGRHDQALEPPVSASVAALGPIHPFRQKYTTMPKAIVAMKLSKLG